MKEPGARKSSKRSPLPLVPLLALVGAFEYEATWSTAVVPSYPIAALVVVAPTAIADEIHAGLEMLSLQPLLPLPIIVATLWPRRVSMYLFKALLSLSHVDAY
jgi:hypothetical protein